MIIDAVSCREAFEESVSSNTRAGKNQKTFITAAYFGSQAPRLFQLLPLLLFFLLRGQVLLCFYLAWDKRPHISGEENTSLAAVSRRFVSTLCDVWNLGVVHGEHPLRLLAVQQAGLPQRLAQAQLQHDAPDLLVPLPDAVQLLHLLPVHGVEFAVERGLDAINHILRSERKSKLVCYLGIGCGKSKKEVS